MTFQILVEKTGDTAEADTFAGALLAAATLVDDADYANCVQGGHRSLRKSIYITQDGAYAGILTELARLGHRAPLSADWARA